MKKTNIGARVLAFLLTFLMLVSLVPTSVLAATVGDIVISDNKGVTGFKAGTLNQDGAINWPIKVYDHLSDGMLFEFAQYQDSTLYSSGKKYTSGGGQYVLGSPMPYTPLGHDYTTIEGYSGKVNTGYADSESKTYKKTKKAAVNNSSPQYMRIQRQSTIDNSYLNCQIADFKNDNGGRAVGAKIRYISLVYRAKGLNNKTYGSNTIDYVGFNTQGATWYRSNTSIKDVNGNYVRNTDGVWKSVVIDMSANWGSGNWSTIQSSGIDYMYIRLSFTDASNNSYFDVAQIGFFGNKADAVSHGQDCLKFIADPGEFVNASDWNAANNTGFGLLYPSNGAAWTSATDINGDGKYTDNYGGNPNTNTNGGKYAAYYTHQIGYRQEDYESNAVYYNNNRRVGKDATTGRYNGTGDKMGKNGIFFINASTYYKSTAYQNKHSGATSYDMSELEFDGYKLLTQGTKGVWTAGLLEGKLNADGTPEYRQETVEYVADLLSKTLTIPQFCGTNGNANYTFVAGVKNAAAYGTTGGKANDLAQGLRNCLDISFEDGEDRGSTPKMGTYAETVKKSKDLKGKFLTVANNGKIATCMDAAYYLLHNTFVADSYNQLQDDYRYLSLSSVTLDSGKQGYIFDGGFSKGGNFSSLVNGSISQATYKANSSNAVIYNGYDVEGGDGTISHPVVDAKDLYYYGSGEASRTTRYPFLPVTDTEAVNGNDKIYQNKMTDSYYFAEDGKRNYATEFGTYRGRNYNYTLASNGEFVYNEEDGLFFEFEGDDDVYLFINDQLVMDLGGGHSISNCAFEVNDYVEWAKDVLENPSEHTSTEIERAQALDLEDGEIATFDFYYMERHGYGANMRIVTNMRITDPALRVEKTAYQGKEIEYGGVVEPEKPVEYNFKLTNSGNMKLYNLTFDDADIGVRLTPEEGLFVKGEDTPTINDDYNGVYVLDARGGTLEAKDLSAVVAGWSPVDSGGTHKLVDDEYVQVTDGTGTHVFLENTINFSSNSELKGFLKTLQGDGLDDSTIDDELTQSGAGLWVDATVTIKGIYYALTDTDLNKGVFDNTVYVTATNRSERDAAGIETLKSEANHRIYLTAIPSYYQWAGNNLFVPTQRILSDASKESGNESSLLNTYKDFFNTVGEDLSLVTTTVTNRFGKVMTYPYVKMTTDSAGAAGFEVNYPDPGVYEFYITMKLNQWKDYDVSKLSLGQYAIIRVLILVTDVNDSQYVIDYGLQTEALDTNGELFKNDELLGDYSGIAAKVMGLSSESGTYRDYKKNTSNYNGVTFNSQNLEESHKIDVNGKDGKVDGHFTFNLSIPKTGREIIYDAPSGSYGLTEVGTTRVHVRVPAAWSLRYDMYLYYWYDGGANNGWPGTVMEKVNNGNYVLSIPSTVPHVIVHNGTDQTENIDINPGQEVWITLDGNLNSNKRLNHQVNYAATDGTIYVSVPDGWGKVNVHMWDDFNNPLSPYPGVEITDTEVIEVDGVQRTFYTMVIPGDITNIQINNGDPDVDGTKQTVDLKIYAGKESYIFVNSTPTEDSAGQDLEYYTAVTTRTLEKVTMYAKIPDDWSQAYFFYWNSNGAHTGITYPGLQMTKGTDGWYSVEVPGDVTNCIVSDGTSETKTEDLLIENVGSDAWITVEEPIDPTAGLKTNATVKVTVPSDWSNVYYYFYDHNGKVGADWPGTKVEKTGSYYEMTVPYGATNVVVNNNDGKQSENLGLKYNVDNIFDIKPYSVVTVDGKSYEYANSTFNGTTTVKVKVPSTYTSVNLHYWNDNGSVATNWPGITLVKGNDGWYTAEVPNTVSEVIINGSGKQTGDILLAYRSGVNYIEVYSDNSYNQWTFDPWEGIDTTLGHHRGIIGYGEGGEAAGFTFTPTDFMDNEYSMYLGLSVHEIDIAPTALNDAIDIGKEVQMYKKVTMIPANVVYYEDDFLGIKYNTEETKNVFHHYGDGSSSLSQSVDQTQQYGQDKVYQGSENDEKSGGSLTDVYINDTSQIAEFEFTGTGFEIIGHTHAVGSGTIMVQVYDKDGEVVAEVPVITEFDQGANKGTDTITAVPIVRVTDLQFGTYTVKISGIPVYDFSALKPGVTTLPTKESYVCIDGVRVFQPLQGDAVDGSHDAYLETEDGAEFTEVRHLIKYRKGFSVVYDDESGLSVSGGTNTYIENRNNALPSDGNIAWKNINVTSIKDYLLAGPNNEVYVLESTEKEKSSLVFYVTDEGQVGGNFQIGIRGMDYGAFMGSENTGRVNATIQYGVEVDGKFAWKTLTTVTSTAEQYYTIPFEQCPYDKANDRYQVAIRVLDTETTGMASFTTVKTKGLTFNALNESEVPDVIYNDNLSNEIIDANGNSLDSSKFVNFLDLVDQMTSDDVVDQPPTEEEEEEEVVPEGVNTSELLTITDSYTKDLTVNYMLSDKTRLYVVSSTALDEETSTTASLIQSQFAADGYDMDLVWGAEEFAKKRDIILKLDTSLAAEGYKVVVNADNAVISYADENAMIYGANYLQKHFRYAADWVESAGTTTYQKNVIKGFTCTDVPDTKERTLHLDVARKYLTKNFVCDMIAEMSWMGYNALELHLGEDAGFRSDFWDPAYFTSPTGNDFSWIVGSEPQYWNYYVQNGHPDVDDDRYLTTSELIEICNTAKEYNIEIIPSFDTPAHVGWMTSNYYYNHQGKTFKYNGTTYTLPNKINYGTGVTNANLSVLNIGNETVKKFSYALHTDIAAFFKQFAGSTKFNICGDEVGLTNTATNGWNYSHFVTYANELNTLLKNNGYTTRMYNDFAERTDYKQKAINEGYTVGALASDIEIVFWSDDNTNYKAATAWASEGRTIYNGMNYWTYYALRIFDTPSYNNLTNYPDWGKDARDPSNEWWSFYCNDEAISYAGTSQYSHWNPTLFSKPTVTNYADKTLISNSQLGGGYFMIWCDYMSLNTEVEMWNGVWDNTSSASKGQYFYSLIDRMWSNAIKQWNWDVMNTVSFSAYEDIRDAQGYFPGYVATASNQSNYMAASNLPEGKTAVGPMLQEYTVTFTNYDGEVLKKEVVMEGNSATAPEDPIRLSDDYYVYTFSGWDKDFTNVTSDMTVVAQYESESMFGSDVAVGKFEVKVSGGSNFKLKVDNSSTRDMGKELSIDTMPLGAKVTVTAETAEDRAFVGWINASTGAVLATTTTYTFYTTGADVLIAMFDVDIANMNLVTFRNNKSNQIVDMQYYSSGDTIAFPDDPSCPGYKFTGWDHTAADIQEKLAQGKDVVVLPLWEAEDKYVTINVTGGAITEHGGLDDSGKYRAYKGTTATANKAESGKKFAYWTIDGNVVSYDMQYKFYPYKDTSLTAVYVNTDTPIEYNVLVNVGVDSTSYDDRNTIFFEWSVPDATTYTFVNAGVMIVDQLNYAENTFVLGTGSNNFTTFVPAGKYLAATGNHSVTQLGVTAGDTYMVRAFVQYRDSEGNFHTVYSDVVEATNE